MSEKDYKSVDIAVQISSSMETMALYKEFTDLKLKFTQDRSGPLVTVGNINDRPICIAPLIHVIEGVRVLYVEATSVLVDWEMIDNWIREVTGKPDIKIQNSPINLPGDINSVLWNRTKDVPSTPL